MSILLLLSVIYLAAIICFVYYLKKFSPLSLKIGHWLLGGGILFHGSVLVGYFTSKGTAWLVQSFETQWSMIGLGFHIFLMILGELLFFFSAGVAVVYLWSDHQFKKRAVLRPFLHISSLPDLDSFLGKCLWSGFIFLSLGMALGFLFAREWWRAPWYLDPKILFCAFTWFIYGVLLMIRHFFSIWVQGRISALMALFAFSALLFLALGVELIFDSQHLQVEMKIQP